MKLNQYECPKCGSLFDKKPKTCPVCYSRTNPHKLMNVFLARVEEADYDLETGEFIPKHYKPIKPIDEFGKDELDND